MKESTGELNMTVVTVVAIAAIVTFFYLVVWPGMKSKIEQNQLCATAVCPASCEDSNKCLCTSIDKDGTEKTVYCQVADTTDTTD